MSTTTLKAEHLSDGWSVVDEDGGRWWPDEEARAEIEASEDPPARAVEMCDAEPMRGTWKS